MPLEWTPALATGHADIDFQHQELVRRADRLLAALRAGDRGEAGPTIAFLSSYAASHFAHEEKLMRESGYAAVAEHRREHDAFVSELGRLAASFDHKGGTALVGLEIHNWLSGWLREHLGATDRAFIDFLRARR